MKEWKKVIVKFYVAAVLLVVPIYYENGYFNTLEAKARIYWIVSGIALATFLAVVLMQGIMGEKIFAGLKARFKQFNMMDICVLAFGLTAIVSWLLSSYGTSALVGDQGWFMGAWTLFSLCLMYFIVSRYQPFDKWTFVFVTISATVLYTLGFLNGLDIDPLGLHRLLIQKEHFEYISTVGNVNSYSGYLSLTLPLLAMVFTIEKRKWLRVWSGIILALGFTNLYMGSSDGAFLGFALGIMFYIYYCLQHREYYDKVLIVGLFYAAATFVVKLAGWFWPGDHVEFQGVAAFILGHNLYIPLAILCVVLLLLKPFLVKHTSQKSDRVLSIVVGVVFLAAVVLVVGYNAMHFSGSWGTKRGYIWTIAVTVFGEGTFKDKLVGVGPDCFGIPVMNQFSDFISEHWGKRVANAHDEFLEYLVTMGILGLVSYVGMYLSSFKDFVKRDHWTEEKAAFFFAIMGYMGQAVVNNPQAMNMAFLFLFLAMMRSFAFPEEKDPQEQVQKQDVRKLYQNKKKKRK